MRVSAKADYALRAAAELATSEGLFVFDAEAAFNGEIGDRIDGREKQVADVEDVHALESLRDRHLEGDDGQRDQPVIAGHGAADVFALEGTYCAVGRDAAARRRG